MQNYRLQESPQKHSSKPGDPASTASRAPGRPERAPRGMRKAIRTHRSLKCVPRRVGKAVRSHRRLKRARGRVAKAIRTHRRLKCAPRGVRKACITGACGRWSRKLFFGQIRYDVGFKRFRYRGSALTSAEFATVAVAHNIKKMMISVMDAGRNGRRLSPPRDVPPAARKEGTEKVSEHGVISRRISNSYLVVCWIFCIFK